MAKSLTIRGDGGTVTTTGNLHAFNLTASGVRVMNLRITGAGTTAGSQSLIRAVGTASKPLAGLIVRGCTLTNSRMTGVEMRHVANFTIESNTIRDVAYAGIMVLSGRTGRVLANKVTNVIQAGNWVNSYGIILSRDSRQSITAAPRTSNVVVKGNTVDGVRKWEAIDTHGGQNITVESNTIKNSFIGIAMVPCPNAGGVDTYAPRGIIVQNNTVDSGVRNGTRGHGIQLVGAGTPSRVVEYATGTISGNTVTGFGRQSSSTGSAIVAYVTHGASIKANILRESSPSGVLAYHNNVGLSIETNTMVDTWTSSAAFTASVFVNSVRQSVTVRGNKATRSTKKASMVNERGLFVGAAAKRPGVSVTSSGNSFKACSKPLVDASRSQKLT